jgi:hypothetical protein
MAERPPLIEAAVQTPIIHRVLIPGNCLDTCGFLAQSTVLPEVPMMCLGRELIVILPMNCMLERWTQGEPFRKDWTIVYSPREGDLGWLADHPDWKTAA